MDIGSLVNQFGLPVGLLLYFIWREYQTNREHKADMRDIAVKAVQALDKSTDAINEGTENTRKSNDLMAEIKGVLSAQGGTSHGRSDT